MRYLVVIVSLLLFCSCTKQVERTQELVVVDSVVIPKKIEAKKPVKPKIGELEQRLIDAGLVNIQALDSTILVDLKYSTTDNFVGVDLYADLKNAYLQPDVAQRLLKSLAYLRAKDSTKTLLIYDAVRPKSVQQKMWDTLKISFQEKIKFLSNPKNHSIHNYGAAVDLTIANLDGTPLDMGAPYDHIGVIAHPRKEALMLAQGKITKQHIKNRQLLRSAMRHAGFFNIQTEWWHFNACRRSVAKAKYKLVE